MFGVLVNHSSIQPMASAIVADDVGAARNTRRLTRMLAQMLGIMTFLPVIALTLKKAV